MKIYTKTGDEGETGLFGGGRVPKDDPRVQAYGDVDELNAAIGLAASLESQTFETAVLEHMQRDLFTIGAQLATPDSARLAKALAPRAPIGEGGIAALEGVIDRLESGLPPLTAFILPGGTPKAAAFHLARTVCRRAERSVVTLARAVAIAPLIVKYLNRLSDLLFVLARAANRAGGGRGDVPW
ncbi:MAG: cob(I)yrinic acid a,c-diamide adenosyltransferase [Gemmatimonadales bacterium]|nr:cob(I)yrinic acid a,c-diamide adenosyltransferase [Gemmatimonadales bacterium]